MAAVAATNDTMKRRVPKAVLFTALKGSDGKIDLVLDCFDRSSRIISFLSGDNTARCAPIGVKGGGHQTMYSAHNLAKQVIGALSASKMAVVVPMERAAVHEMV